MPTVLYIEDDDNNRLLIRRLLTAYGFDVNAVDNAAEGIRLAQASPPDLILMDLSMPGMDGLTATRRIRETPSIADIKVIALTANALEGDEARSIEAGCNGYISKPIDIDSFVDEINNYLGK
jgi:two-component system, cell cycle response regulator DivK